MRHEPIVEKTPEAVKPESYSVSPFRKPGGGEWMTFEVNLTAEAEAGMHKTARVEPNLDAWSAFEIHCDEGTAIGGEDSAPPPLSYLSAGVAFCLLTHLQHFSRAENLQVQRIRREQRMRFATLLGSDAPDTAGRCDGVETHVRVHGSEEETTIRSLVDRSWRACMAMQAIVSATPQTTAVHLNGRPLR